MTQLKAAVNKAKKTVDFKTALKPADLLGVRAIINAIQDVNQALSETVNWWATKNLKKLEKAIQHATADNDALNKEYAKFDDQGRMYVWNGKDDDLLFVIDGRRAIDPITKDAAPKGNYFPYVADESKRDAYNKAVKDFNDTPREVNLVKINRDLLANIQIPTSNAAGFPIDGNLFYDNIVIDEEDDE